MYMYKKESLSYIMIATSSQNTSKKLLNNNPYYLVVKNKYIQFGKFKCLSFHFDKKKNNKRYGLFHKTDT